MNSTYGGRNSLVFNNSFSDSESNLEIDNQLQPKQQFNQTLPNKNNNFNSSDNISLY